jgi:hypothetical protein
MSKNEKEERDWNGERILSTDKPGVESDARRFAGNCKRFFEI